MYDIATSRAKDQAARVNAPASDAEAMRIAKERRFAMSASMLTKKNITVSVENNPALPMAYMDIHNNHLMLNEGDKRLDAAKGDEVKALIYNRANLLHEVDHALFTRDEKNKVKELGDKATNRSTFDMLRNVLEDGRAEWLGKMKFAGSADFLNALLMEIVGKLGASPLDGLHLYVRTGFYRNKAEAKFWKPFEKQINKAIRATSTSRMLDIAFAIAEAIANAPKPPPQGDGNGEPREGESGEQGEGGEGEQGDEPQGEQGEGDSESEAEGEESESGDSESESGDEESASEAEAEAEGEDSAEGEGDGSGDSGDEGEDSDSDSEGGEADSESEGGEGEAEAEGEGEAEGESESDSDSERQSNPLGAGGRDAKPEEFDKEAFDKLSKLVSEAMERCEAEAEADYEAIVTEAQAYEAEQAYNGDEESAASEELANTFRSLLVETARTRYSAARAGLLNQAALASVLTSKKCFHRREDTPDAPHVALLLDVSGSMLMRADDLTSVARIINGALRKAKIATKVITFGGEDSGDGSLNEFRVIPTVEALQVHGGTPTHLAMRAASDWLESEAATRGLVIVATDGVANHLNLTQNELQRAEQIGAHVVGVLIGYSEQTSPAKANALSVQFHEHAFAPLVSDITQVVETLLAGYIAKG